MRVLDWEEFVGGDSLKLPISATVGVFDGLHIGHRRLVQSVFEHGRDRLTSVFTFKSNPKVQLRPTAFHGSLSSLDQKLESLDSLGLEVCVLIDFSGNFSKLAGRDFLSILREKGNLEYIAVGSNFSCGYKLDTHANDVKAFFLALGIEAEVLEPVLWGGHAVSSSRIRNAIVEGRLEDAAAMMGRDYELDLRGVRKIRSEPGAAAFERPTGLVLPPLGCYEATVTGKGSRTVVRLGVQEAWLEILGISDASPEKVAIHRLTQETKR